MLAKKIFFFKYSYLGVNRTAIYGSSHAANFTKLGTGNAIYCALSL